MRVAVLGSGVSGTVVDFDAEVSDMGTRCSLARYVGDEGCEEEKGGLELHLVDFLKSRLWKW